MGKIIKKDVFEKDAFTVAEELLSSKIAKKEKERILKLDVKEIEIYEGFKDCASHAVKGRTERNSVMFEKGGIFYIYLVYGMHFMLNVVVGKKDYPAAILIRSVGDFYGPGKLTRALKIDKSYNKKLVGEETGLWFEKTKKVKKIKKGPRIGVDYAGKYWKNAHLRFFCD